MNQLWIFIIQGVFIAICGQIDNAFGNNISLDAICVLSAFTVINLLTYCTYQIGGYAFRILLSKEKNCMFASVSTSIAIGAIIVIFSKHIPRLYTLTENQYIIFEKCLIVHGLTMPLLAIGEFLFNFMKFKCMNKKLIITNILFSAIMIGFDAIIYLQGGDLNHLLLATTIAYFVYDLALVYCSGILKSTDKINIKDLKIVVKHGINIIIDRITNNIGALVYNVFASKMGTELFAIHSVCYSISCFTENTTGALADYSIVRLATIETLEDKFNKCKQILKKYFIPIFFISYIISYLMLTVMHGDVSINVCIIPLALYCSRALFIQLYEILRGYITSIRKSELLKWSGLIGLLSRALLGYIAYQANLGLAGFAAVVSIDYTLRGVYLLICHKVLVHKSKKYIKEKRRSRINEA